jgi:hypothetical protein
MSDLDHEFEQFWLLINGEPEFGELPDDDAARLKRLARLFFQIGAAITYDTQVQKAAENFFG